MSDLPAGWEWTKLGELGAYLNGRGFKKSEWKDRGRPIIRIQNLTGSGVAFNYYEGEAEERHTVRDGDLLVSWAATLGVYVWRGPEAVLNQHIFKVESHVHPGFHRHLLDFVLSDLQRQTHGSGMVHITKGKFDLTKVPLPPAGEQERIVAAIEEHLSRLDAAESALASARSRLASFRSSTTSDALRGDWPVVRLGDHTVGQCYGSSAKAGREGDVPILRMGNIVDGHLDFADLKYLPNGHPDLKTCTLAPGDLLFNRTNSPELVGKSAVFEGQATPVTFASYLIRVRVDQQLDPRWVVTAINSPAGRRYIDTVRTQQVGQANVNGTKLKDFPIPMPSIDVQRERLTQLYRARDWLREVESEIDRALTRASTLRRSVLAAAFSGKLVPHDPGEEPASVLLERIRDRAATTPTRRTRAQAASR